MLRDSSHCASANRKVTVAASDHWPMAMAPATAMSISDVDVEGEQARGRPGAPGPVPAARGNRHGKQRTRHGGRGLEPVQRHAGGHGSAGRDEERLPAVARPAVMLDAVSWSSHARIPVPFTASAMAAAESCAAS